MGLLWQLFLYFDKTPPHWFRLLCQSYTEGLPVIQLVKLFQVIIYLSRIPKCLKEQIYLLLWKEHVLMKTLFEISRLPFTFALKKHVKHPMFSWVLKPILIWLTIHIYDIFIHDRRGLLVSASALRVGGIQIL